MKDPGTNRTLKRSHILAILVALAAVGIFLCLNSLLVDSRLRPAVSAAVLVSIAGIILFLNRRYLWAARQLSISFGLLIIASTYVGITKDYADLVGAWPFVNPAPILPTLSVLFLFLTFVLFAILALFVTAAHAKDLHVRESLVHDLQHRQGAYLELVGDLAVNPALREHRT